MGEIDAPSIPTLLCRVQRTFCALPLTSVVETMRPLPVQRLGGLPPFLCGVAIIRGEAVPVVDLATLLGLSEDAPTRYVTLRVGEHHVALAVSEVVGVRALLPARLGELPGLLRDSTAQFVQLLGTLDERLLLVLNGARLVPDGLWKHLDSGPIA
ncbi:MAG: chemotaxis protein CheW [Deltaproteobacteria bacterium]|nr:chemotaxis protein CheW [Deltaproteobacteria bacterium]